MNHHTLLPPELLPSEVSMGGGDCVEPDELLEVLLEELLEEELLDDELLAVTMISSRNAAALALKLLSDSTAFAESDWFSSIPQGSPLQEASGFENCPTFDALNALE